MEASSLLAINYALTNSRPTRQSLIAEQQLWAAMWKDVTSAGTNRYPTIHVVTATAIDVNTLSN
jgi:hypothetical protein